MERFISWHNAILYNDDGRIVGTLSSGDDLTDLIESEEKFKSITEQSIASISIFQKDDIVYINNVFVNVIGYPYKKIISWGVDELLEKIAHPDDFERIMNLSKKTRAGLINTLQNTEFKIIRKDGEIRWINSFFRSISNKSKPAALNFFLDITENKKNELELKRFAEELEKKVELRTKALKEVNERMDLYRNLFAHDINNIFNNVKIAAELCKPYLNDPSKLEKLNELHHVIEEQIIRGDKLINNVRKLTSLEDSKFPLKKENLNQILSNSIEFIYNSFPNREISVNKEIANKKFFVNANELLLDVFENILINSIKHNKNPQVEIDIAVSKTEIEKKKYIKLQFRDNGNGISDKRKQIIFQRQKAVKKGEGGMGLGLSLVKKIIDSYNGKIWVEDRIKEDYRKGSNFIVLIPEAK